MNPSRTTHERVRWRERGDTHPARAANSLRRLGFALVTLSSEREPQASYFERMPDSLREYAQRIRTCLRPAHIYVEVHQLLNDAEDNLRQSLQETFWPQPPVETEPHIETAR